MIKQLMLGGGVSIGLLSPLARATPAIAVGDHVLAPGVNGQTVLINVGGGDAVMGTDVVAQVADGGPSAGGTVVGPVFRAADLLTGTIFASNNSGQQDQTSFGTQDYAGAVVTASGTVPASGLLATFTLDSTGIGQGVYPLLMTNIQHGNVTGTTDFGLTPATITNGNLIVSIPGDLNLDGTVNFSDLLTLVQHYGSAQPATLAGYQVGNIDQNGTVNFSDLLTLVQHYNQTINITPPPPVGLAAIAADALVPEPAALGLAVLGAGMLLRRSRR